MTFGFTPDYFHREVVEKIPMDKLLLETDAPYFRPIEVQSQITAVFTFAIKENIACRCDVHARLHIPTLAWSSIQPCSWLRSSRSPWIVS